MYRAGGQDDVKVEYKNGKKQKVLSIGDENLRLATEDSAARGGKCY